MEDEDIRNLNSTKMFRSFDGWGCDFSNFDI